MGGHQHEATALADEAVEPLGRERGHHLLTAVRVVLQAFTHREEGIDAGVAGHQDALVRDAFTQQVEPCRRGRREVHLGDGTYELAVHLLREGCIDVARAQARLHVRDLDLGVERGQCGHEGGGGVALHDQPAGTHLFQDGGQAVQHPRGDAGQGLVRPHQVEVEVRHDAEEVQHAVEHLAVLRGDADGDLEPAVGSCGQHDRSQLDGLGTGPEDEEQGGRRCAQRDTSFSPTGTPRCGVAEQKPHPSAPVARLSRGRRTADRESRSSRGPDPRTRPVDSRAVVPIAPTPPSPTMPT